MSIFEKRTAVREMGEDLSISDKCKLLGLPRSGYYRKPVVGLTAKNRRLIRMIDEEYTRHPFLDTRQMVRCLKEYASALELKRDLGEYFNYYSTQRPRSSLKGRTPREVYKSTSQSREAA